MEQTNVDDFKLDVNSLKELSNCLTVYHEGQDSLFIRPEKPVPATSYDWDGELWLRVNPETGEIVGLEIENFESVFLKKHPEVAKVWKTVRPQCIRRRIENKDDLCESFLRVLIDFLFGLLRDSPQQARFSAI